MKQRKCHKRFILLVSHDRLCRLFLMCGVRVGLPNAGMSSKTQILRSIRQISWLEICCPTDLHFAKAAPEYIDIWTYSQMCVFFLICIRTYQNISKSCAHTWALVHVGLSWSVLSVRAFGLWYRNMCWNGFWAMNSAKSILKDFSI